MRKSKWFKRIVSSLMVTVMLAGTLTACGQRADTSSEKADSKNVSSQSSLPESDISRDSSSEVSPQDDPGEKKSGEGEEKVYIALNTDTDSVNIPEPDAEIHEELVFTTDGIEIIEPLEASDVTLEDSFEGMKVDSVKSEGNEIILDISGKPAFSTEDINTGNVGKIRFDGKNFGLDAPLQKKLTVTQMTSNPIEEGGFFHPFFKWAEESDKGYILYIILKPRGAEFVEGFDEEDITLSVDFADAEILSLDADEENESWRVLSLEIPAEKEEDNTWFFAGGITIAENSLVDSEGVKNAEPLTVTRTYSAASLGRGATPWPDPQFYQQDIDTLSDILGVYGVNGWKTFAKTLAGASTAANVGTLALGFLGIIPNDKTMHVEALNMVKEIQATIDDLNEKTARIKDVLDQQTAMLEQLQKSMYEDTIANFENDLLQMTRNRLELENALAMNKNKINAFNEIADDKEILDEDGMKKALDRLGKKICAMPFNNTQTIGEKVQELDSNYKRVAAWMQASGKANPVYYYIELHKLTDNYSTTSLTAKRLYGLNIKSELTLALNMLDTLNGVDANASDHSLYDGCTYPDVDAGVYKNGRPYCYVMNQYVDIARQTADSFYTSINGSHTEDKPYKRLMTTSDLKEFCSRIKGNLKNDLIIAGFSEASLGIQTTEADHYLSHTGNKAAAGLGFVYYQDSMTKGGEMWRDDGIMGAFHYNISEHLSSEGVELDYDIYKNVGYVTGHGRAGNVNVSIRMVNSLQIHFDQSSTSKYVEGIYHGEDDGWYLDLNSPTLYFVEV